MNIYLGSVLRCIDGDTLDLRVDLGFGIHVDVRCHLLGVKASPGLPSKVHLEDLLKTSNQVMIKSHKGRAANRWLVEITGERGENINQIMVSDGFASTVD